MHALMGHVRAAADKYAMIEEGDRIAVGVSGGKDSLYLLYALAMMRRYYPKRYEITALTADPCFSGAETDYSAVEALCMEWGVEYRIRRTNLGKVIFEDRREENPCSLCAPGCAAASCTIWRRTPAAERLRSATTSTTRCRPF